MSRKCWKAIEKQKDYWLPFCEPWLRHQHAQSQDWHPDPSLLLTQPFLDLEFQTFHSFKILHWLVSTLNSWTPIASVPQVLVFSKYRETQQNFEHCRHVAHRQSRISDRLQRGTMTTHAWGRWGCEICLVGGVGPERRCKFSRLSPCVMFIRGEPSLASTCYRTCSHLSPHLVKPIWRLFPNRLQHDTNQRSRISDTTIWTLWHWG